MLDISSWEYFYKMDYAYGYNTASNLLYTPKISPDGSVMAMIYDEKQEYQHENIGLTKELTDFFFEREIKYLKIFQKYDWAPTLLDVDYDNRILFIEFNKETLIKYF